MKETAADSKLLDVRGGFADKHPEFRPTFVTHVDGKDRSERIEMDRRKERSNLLFPHKTHLEKTGIEEPDRKKVVLACASCHAHFPLRIVDLEGELVAIDIGSLQGTQAVIGLEVVEHPADVAVRHPNRADGLWRPSASSSIAIADSKSSLPACPAHRAALSPAGTGHRARRQSRVHEVPPGR